MIYKISKKSEKWKKIKFNSKNKKKYFFNTNKRNAYNKIGSRKPNYLYKFFTVSIKLLILILSIRLIEINSFKDMYETNTKNIHQYIDTYHISSKRWIVMTAINPPSVSILNLEKHLEKWKIVVIGNIKKIDSNWDIFKNSDNLVYLSLQAQKQLGYNILKYLKDDSYSRKNIGYLFAIQHGAKEIYEIDENLILSTDSSNFLNNIYNSYICYGVQNEQHMINPYIHFGETKIWPRGFFYKDIMEDYNKSIYYTHNSHVISKPLIYQGLINTIPDIDSLTFLTSSKSKENLNITFLKNYPLIYFPGSYVPINSKNTKYLYEIFPFLMLPVTINESIADIIRGYILERFAFGYGGLIVFHNSDAIREKIFVNDTKIIEEKKILFHLDKILDIIKSNKLYSGKKPINLLFHILTELIKYDFLKVEELDAYKSFLEDLSNIGCVCSTNNKFLSKINNNYKDYLNITSEFIYYLPQNPNLMNDNNDNFKIYSHSSSNTIYNDILLIINYNMPGYLNLNEYLEKLYNKSFPNIVYLYPQKIKTDSSNIIICKESKNGFYSYKCIRNVFRQFPNYKGYLLTNDDNFFKIWELENFDFNIPWLYRYEPDGINQYWMFYSKCKYLNHLYKHNSTWKENATNFFGFNKVFNGFSDLYYIPNYYMSIFTQLVKEMYNSKIFLECAVPATFAIISAQKYQMIYIRPIWAYERRNILNILRSEYQQFSIHPIKFSNDELKEGVNKYNYFINAIDF